jgi:hypothetical protein
MDLACIGNAVGVDLWHYQTADGRSIMKAAEYMAPYADPASKWPHQQIRPPNHSDLQELMVRAAAEFPGSQPVKDALKTVKADDYSGNPVRLYLKTAIN